MRKKIPSTYVLVSQVFQQLQLAVGAFREHWCAEWLHDLLDSHRLAGELVLGRTVSSMSIIPGHGIIASCSPYKPKGSHAHRLQVCVSAVLSVSVAQPAPDPRCFSAIPARNLKGRAKDLSTHEFRHLAGISLCVVVVVSALLRKSRSSGVVVVRCGVGLLEWASGQQV